MSKVVQLSEEAYGLLRNLKRPGESFSDVVLRIGGGRSLRALQQIVTPKDAKEIARSIREIDRLDRA
jgi:predicted CopG family antitoxin